MNTLFLRDSTLFLLKDGVEYEVENPEVVDQHHAGYFTLPPNSLGKFSQPNVEWPYGVEVIYACGNELCQSDNQCMSCAKPLRLARLISKKEECPKCRTKDFASCNSMYCPVRKPVESSEPQENCLTGEKCRCGKDATHKISEEILPHEDQNRHPLTQYVCDDHFNEALRPYVKPVSAPVESQEELWRGIESWVNTMQGHGYQVGLIDLTKHIKANYDIKMKPF